TLPASLDDRATVARMMGLADEAGLLAELDARRVFVAQQFDAIFAEKSSGAEPVDPGASVTDPDNRDAIADRLASLGFDQPGPGADRLIATWQAPRLQTLPEASRNRLVALVNAALPQI